MREISDLSIFSRQKTTKRIIDANAAMIGNAGRQTVCHDFWMSNEQLLKEPIYCNYICKSILEHYIFQRRRYQRFLSLEYIYEGEFYVRSSNRGFILEAGDLFLMHPSEQSELLYLPGKRCRNAGMVVGGKNLLDILQMLHLKNVVCLKLSNQERFEKLMTLIGEKLPNLHTVSDCEKNSGLVFELLCMLSNIATDIHSEPRQDRIRNYLGSNLNAALNVTQIAANFGMSLPTFNKYLKKTTGMTPHQYRLNSRIQKACDLLTNTDLSIKEIAEATGFQNQLYFSAAFRKHCGTSPASYRKNR